MPFETYTPRGGKKEKLKSPIVSFSKNSIVLNNVAREKLNTDKVNLAYDREERVIRIGASSGNDGGLQIKKTKIFGKGFYSYFNINPKGKYEAEYDEKENCLYVRL